MITDLIPQRDPILMVDDARKGDGSFVVTSLLVAHSNWFCKDGLLVEAGLVEHMAQSAAAMVGLNWDGEPREGYIGDIKNMSISRLPKVGEVVESKISVITQLDNITLIEAESYIGSEVIASARIKVFIAE